MRNFVFLNCMFCSFLFFVQLRLSWSFGSFKIILLSLRKNSNVFHVRPHNEVKKFTYTVPEEINFPEIDKTDSEFHFSEHD